MDIEKAVKHLRWRLDLANHGYRITWSLDDRAAISALCSDATQHMLAGGQVVCTCKQRSSEYLKDDQWFCGFCKFPFAAKA